MKTRKLSALHAFSVALSIALPVALVPAVARAQQEDPPLPGEPPPPSSLPPDDTPIVPTTPPAPQPAPPREPITTNIPAGLDECDKERDNRELGGHVYVFPSLQPTPFVTSYVGVQIAVTSTTANGVSLGRLGQIDGQQFSLVNRVDGGIKLAKWLGITLNASGSLVTGTNVGTLVLEGGAYDYAAGAGIIARLFRLDTTQLSAQISGRYENGQTFSLRRLVTGLTGDGQSAQTVEDVLEGGLGRTLLVPQEGYQGTAGLQLAQTVTKMLGLQFSGGVTYRRLWIDGVSSVTLQEEEGRSTFFSPSVGGAVSLDLLPLKIPIAVLGEAIVNFTHRTDTLRQVNDNLTQPSFAVGAYLSGVPHLQFGFVASMALHLPPVVGIDGTESDNSRQMSGALVLRYVW